MPEKKTPLEYPKTPSKQSWINLENAEKQSDFLFAFFVNLRQKIDMFLLWIAIFFAYLPMSFWRKITPIFYFLSRLLAIVNNSQFLQNREILTP